MRIGCAACVLGLLLAMAAAASAAATAAHERRFQVRYTAALTGLPADAKTVRVWLPAPQSDAWQTIANLSVESPYPQTRKQEPEYGNGILYFQGPPPAGGTLTIVMTFDVTRREYVNRPGSAGCAPWRSRRCAPARALPQRPIVWSRSMARSPTWRARSTQGNTTDRDKARAIYEYVTTHLRYDKSGTGWGRGDALWACDTKRGNCTDYHSLLIGMARSVGIPGKVRDWSAGADRQPEGPIGGYHCWAAFYLDGRRLGACG